MPARILIVDDQHTFARNVASHLRRAGLASYSASRAGAARALIDDQRFDAICLDLNLPDGSGFDLLAQMRESRPELPVVVMSGEDSKDNRRRASALGAAAFLTKPFSLRELRSLVIELTGHESEPAPATRAASRAAPAAPSMLMYSHDGFGLGHLRRNLNIASRFVQQVPGASVLMMVGSPSADLMSMPPGVDFVKLPSIVKVGTNDWRPRRLQVSADSARDLRSRLILRTAELLRPELFVADHVPAGVWGELLPTLQMFRRLHRPPHTVLGLRDILDDPATVRETWRRDGIEDVIAQYYDEVFVYGQRDVFDAAASYGLDPARVHYCGYVCNEERPQAPERVREALGAGDGDRLVVVTGGGGYDARPMMEGFLDALATMTPGERPRAAVITGPLMSADDRAALAGKACGLPVEILTSVASSLDYFAAADLVVTMAGYNTLLEGLRLATPMIVVPRRGPSAEQRTRASTFARLGLTVTVDPDDLHPRDFARAILDRLRDGAPARFTLDGNGAGGAASRLAAALTETPAGSRDLQEAIAC